MPIWIYKLQRTWITLSLISDTKRTLDSFKWLFRHLIQLLNPRVPYVRLFNQNAPQYAVKDTLSLLAFIHLMKNIDYKIDKSKNRISYTTNGHWNLEPIDMKYPLRMKLKEFREILEEMWFNKWSRNVRIIEYVF